MSKLMKNEKTFRRRCNLIPFPIDKLKQLTKLKSLRSFRYIVYTLVLNVSTTLAALPVTLIKISPRHRVGWAIPNRAQTFAPAPSPKPMTYFTCKKSRTVTRSSPSVFNDGNWKLYLEKLRKTEKNFTIFCHSYESGRLSALSA